MYVYYSGACYFTEFFAKRHVYSYAPFTTVDVVLICAFLWPHTIWTLLWTVAVPRCADPRDCIFLETTGRAFVGVGDAVVVDRVVIRALMPDGGAAAVLVVVPGIK